jgi:hypothetical protein
MKSAAKCAVQAAAKPLFLKVGRKLYEVASLKEASEKFCAARDASGEGASETPIPLIVHEDGTLVGYVSYNGRVWAGSPKDPYVAGRVPLYDNGTGLRS